MYILYRLKEILEENIDYSKDELLKIIYNQINLYELQKSLFIKLKLKENKNINIELIIDEYKKKRNLIFK
tara:strand:+ start:268 stop:477 length:210 start_codon:yes stop_codon:yes gene_type:complete